MGGESPEDEIGRKGSLTYSTFGAYFWPQCMIMYPSLQKCWEHWPPKPHSRPQSQSFLGHEILVRYTLGRVDLWTRIPKPVKARNWTGPILSWQNTVNSLLSPPRRVTEFKHIWWGGDALIFAEYHRDKPWSPFIFYLHQQFAKLPNFMPA